MIAKNGTAGGIPARLALALAALLPFCQVQPADGRGLDAAQIRAAAERGDPAAMRTLGCMHYAGEGVAKSRSRAAQWFRRAAAKGDASAKRMLAAMQRTDGAGSALVKAPRQEEPAAVENADPAQDLPTLAQAGDVNAQAMLGIAMFGAARTPDELRQASYWIERAADGGSPHAKGFLGLMYAEGIGRAQDYVLARPLLEEGAKAGMPQCFGMLGRMHLRGLGVRQDYREAASLLRKGAELGDRTAQRELAGMLISGAGIRQNCGEARRWLEASASSGEAMAAMELAMMLAGNGACGAGEPERNAPQIKEWFGKACDAGLQEGCDAYRMMNSEGMKPAPKNQGGSPASSGREDPV